MWKFGKPKPKAIAKAAAVDAKARSQAAKAAVELSLSWAPRAGLAQGLQLSDPMIPLVREVHEERVGAFEPKGVWAAINQFRAWRAFRESKSTRVPLSLLQWPARFRGRRMVWYVVNTSALASFVKGASANPALEQIVGLFWMPAWHLDLRVWFEWVDSNSNWSDGVSREFDQDEFAARHGFHLQPMSSPDSHWGGSWLEVWRFAERASKEQALGIDERAQ